jgi:hypothetical protein
MCVFLPLHKQGQTLPHHHFPTRDLITKHQSIQLYQIPMHLTTYTLSSNAIEIDLFNLIPNICLQKSVKAKSTLRCLGGPGENIYGDEI